MMPTIYEAAGGRKGLIDLAHAWHKRCLADPVVSHALSHGFHPNHSERLAAYWSAALGGPSDYSDAIGDEAFVVRLHSGNGLHDEMDARAIDCFARALEDVGLSANTELNKTLMDYFRWATGAMNQFPESADDVPAQLPFGKWSWDGPADR